MASLCSSTTAGSESGSDISMHLQIQSCRTPWQAAELRASIVAARHCSAMKQREAARKSEKKKKRSPEEKYIDELSQKYTVDISYCLQVAPYDKFEKFRSEFFYSHGHCFLEQLQHLYLNRCSRWNLRATPVSQWVRQKFLDTLESENLEGSNKLLMAFHGTHQKSLPSIYNDGLLVPGLGNVIKVANGSAYGCGIYAARSDSASTSWGYSRGNMQPMLICAALDGPKGIVRHGGNFMVFFQNHRVVPLFEASVAEYQLRIPAPVPARTPPPVIFVRKRVADPWKKPKGPGPRTRSLAPKVPDVKAFLSRRAACKRRGTSWNG